MRAQKNGNDSENAHAAERKSCNQNTTGSFDFRTVTHPRSPRYRMEDGRTALLIKSCSIEHYRFRMLSTFKAARHSPETAQARAANRPHAASGRREDDVITGDADDEGERHAKSRRGETPSKEKLL